MTGNTNASTVDLGSLTTTGGDTTVTGNTNASTVDLGSLTSVEGDLTIADNGTNTMVNLGSLTNVDGSFTIETHGQTDVNFSGVNVGGDTSIEAHDATTVSAETAPGTTDVSLINGAASMTAELASGAFASPVQFSMEQLSGAPLDEQPAMMGGQPVMADPVTAYEFDFTTPTLNQPAQLTFDIYLPGFGAGEQAALLSAADAGHLTLAVKADAPGSEYQLFDVCEMGAPVLDTCARLSKLDANGVPLPPGSMDTPTTLRLEGVVGHFSTYAAVTYTPVPAMLVSPAVSAGTFGFSFTAQSGVSYEVEYTDSLNPMNWLSLTNFMGGGSVWQVMDPIGTNAQRYYRVVAQ